MIERPRNRECHRTQQLAQNTRSNVDHAMSRFCSRELAIDTQDFATFARPDSATSARSLQQDCVSLCKIEGLFRLVPEQRLLADDKVRLFSFGSVAARSKYKPNGYLRVLNLYCSVNAF
jgi:hypothetical protein